MKISTKTVFLLLLPLLTISCGNEESSTLSNIHTHAPVSDYAKDESGHYHPCSCESDIRFDFEAHTYSKNSEGLQACTTCGYIEHEEQETAWKIIKTSLMNSLQYDGALTANVTMESQEGEDSLKANETFSTDPTSGKTVHVSKAEAFDPTTSKWVTANEEKSKVEVDEDDFVLYEFSGTDVTATNVDKEYAVSSTGTNPWDLFGSSFKGDVNSLSEILSKMDSFAELYEYLPSMLEMDEDMNLKFSADISTKDNFYILSLKGESFLQDFDYGEIGSESAGAYTFTFDKNTLLSLGVVSYTKSEHLNEKRNKESKENMVYSFTYSFDKALYESTTFETKPTPSGYAQGAIDLEFEGGYLWEGAFRLDINHAVNEIAAPNGLELFYDKEMKKPVSGEEMFSTLRKKYYASPKILSDRSFVITMMEINYKVPSKFSKFMTEYVERCVIDYRLYSSADTHSIYRFPSSDEEEYRNAKVTVNGATVTSNIVSVVLGNLYTVLIKIDGVATPIS